MESGTAAIGYLRRERCFENNGSLGPLAIHDLRRVVYRRAAVS